MTKKDIRGLMLSHTGYAIVCFGVVSLLLEQVLTGFVSTYLNPYLLVISGLFLASFGTMSTYYEHRSRSLWTAVIIVVSLWFIANKILSLSSGIVLWMLCLVLGAVFFAAKEYSEDV